MPGGAKDVPPEGKKLDPRHQVRLELSASWHAISPEGGCALHHANMVPPDNAAVGRRPRPAIGPVSAVYAIRMVNPPSMVKVSPVR